jgi:hypothetical protein
MAAGGQCRRSGSPISLYGSWALEFHFIAYQPFRSRKESASVSQTDYRTVIRTLVVLSLFLPAYASHNFPDYPVHPADEYANKVVKPGLTVAVEPVEDPEQQKTYFNSHLNSSGILPVFIVIQNTSATDSYLFDRSAVGLGGAGAPTGKGGRKTASLLTSGGLVDVALINDVTHERDNLLKKEVRSKTLSPGSSVYGFVYVPVPTDAPRGKLQLQVPLTNTQSGEIELVNLFF